MSISSPKQKPWPSLILALLALGVGASQANSQNSISSVSGNRNSYSLGTAIAKADRQSLQTGKTSVLEGITLTDDGVILSVDGQQLLDPDIKVDGDRVSITLQGLELASSIPIDSQNTLPEASLLKRRLKIRQLEPGVVEISLSAGQQEWTATPHSQGVFLVPTAIAGSQGEMQIIGQGELSPEDQEVITSAENIETPSMVAEEKPQQEFIAQQVQVPEKNFQVDEKPRNTEPLAQAEQEVEIVNDPVFESDQDLIAGIDSNLATTTEDADEASLAMANENQETSILKVASNIISSEMGSSDLNNAPLMVAQSSEMPQATLEELKEQLLIPPVPAEKLARRYYPTLTYGVPSAFGPGWGDLFISATGATPGNNRDGQVDGNISMGFGLGDPVENVGLSFGYNIGSINNFGRKRNF